MGVGARRRPMMLEPACGRHELVLHKSAHGAAYHNRRAQHNVVRDGVAQVLPGILKAAGRLAFQPRCC